jgi:long-subunit acyl-CoA synthetase (AMP-forming)
MGIHMIGGISVGIYPKQSVEALQYLFELADTRAVFVEAEADLVNMIQAIKGNPKVVALVCWDDEVALKYRPTDPRVLPWSVVIKEPIAEAEVEHIVRTQKPENVAAYMFSSGTTGSAPKGN